MPISPESLTSCIRDQLDKLERRAIEVLARPQTSRRSRRLPISLHWTRHSDFLSNLSASTEEVLARLDDGWIRRDPVDIVRRFHNLAGTAATLGCRALSEAAAVLQKDGTPSTANQQRFVKAAHATLVAIRSYISKGVDEVARPVAQHTS